MHEFEFNSQALSQAQVADYCEIKFRLAGSPAVSHPKVQLEIRGALMCITGDAKKVTEKDWGVKKNAVLKLESVFGVPSSGGCLSNRFIPLESGTPKLLSIYFNLKLRAMRSV
jgi:hypothetical protein